MEEAIVDKKLELIISTAQKIFFERGFRKVSIDEFCSIAGVSKMTFYKHFNSKEDLVVFLFNDIIKKNFARYKDIVNSDKSFTDKIELMINLKLEQTSLFGKAFLEDIFQSGPEIQKMLLEKQEESKSLFRQFYNMGVKEGFTSSDINPDFFIAASEQIIQMGNTPSIIYLYPDPHERARHLTNFFFYGIRGNQHQRKDEAVNHE